MMTGYLAQKHDVHVGNKRFGRALAKVCPQHHVQRKTNTAKFLNPIPERAEILFHFKTKIECPFRPTDLL